MDELIKVKLKEFKDNYPSSPEFKSWLKQNDLWTWLYNVFNIQGQNISKPCIVDLVNGKLLDDVPLSCYSFVLAIKEIYKDIQNDLNMQSNPSLKLFARWADMLDCAEYRKSNPVVYEYGIIPCHFNTVEEELDEAFRKYAMSKDSEIDKAAKLFLDIVKIYPYEEETIDMAMIVLMYVLLKAGYPLPELGLSEQEFSNAMKSAMDDKCDYSFFIDALKRSIYNRLDSIVLIEKQLKEQSK